MSAHPTTASSTANGRNFRQPEAADFLAMSPATFRRRAKEDGFPQPVKIGPRVRIWREVDLVAYLDTQARKQAEGSR